jgi:membrane-associated protease RseP (regulator of RpoE activity)
MIHSMRPFRSLVAGLVVSAGIAWAPGAAAQGRTLIQFLPGSSPLLLGHSGSQGYLGVDLADVDNDKAQALKLKEVRGALITLIDHDAPAGQVGLHVNDVVVQLNGQTVESAEQLRRMLRELPAGRKVSLEISRDGNLQTLSVQLADRHAMEQEIWNRLGKGGSEDFTLGPGFGMMPGGADAPLPGGFHMPSFGSGLNVGALVEPLTSQMAEYLGVSSGLMVKQVAHKSEAAAAGLKAFDVILKVGAEPIGTVSDWDRALRSNLGKPVQITILRDKKQQTVTLQVDSKRHQGELMPEGCFGQESSQMAGLVAEIELDRLPARAEELRRQAEKLHEPMQQRPQIDQMELDRLSQQMEKMRQSFRAEDFQLDSQQREELKRQLEQLRRNLPQLLLDRQRMQEQMDQLKRQMEELKAQGFGDHV